MPLAEALDGADGGTKGAVGTAEGDGAAEVPDFEASAGEAEPFGAEGAGNTGILEGGVAAEAGTKGCMSPLEGWFDAAGD